ncbi:MAG: threonine synthase [bacterium]
MIALACVKCGRRYDAGAAITCPSCGLEGILDVEYDYDRTREAFKRQPLRQRKERSIWRYSDLLPTSGLGKRMRRVGWTPLYAFPALAEAVGHRDLFIKDDTVNPSASLKDRASAVAVSMAVEKGAEGICCASTGNAASSLAVLSASVGLKSYIFVPATIPKPKLYQLAACAERVFKVAGTYEDAFDLATRAIDRWGWENRNCAINPYLVEGKKTCSLEIYEQLGWRVPDWVVVSVGDGCIVSAQWKAFKELKAVGETTSLPRVLAVQAEGARPIVDAFESGGDLRPVRASTLADSIRVGAPRNWRKAVRALRESGGSAVAVTDGEIVDAALVLARTTGVFAEPAAAAALAGLRKAVAAGTVSAGETAVVLITGSGLKDPESVAAGVRVCEVGDDLDEVERCL